VRNLKAEEERILDIMKRARSIKETLQVDQRLSEVRGRSRRWTASSATSSFQVSMATLNVTLSEKATILHLPEEHWAWLNEVSSAWHSAVTLAQALATVVTYGGHLRHLLDSDPGISLGVRRAYSARRPPARLTCSRTRSASQRSGGSAHGEDDRLEYRPACRSVALPP